MRTAAHRSGPRMEETNFGLSYMVQYQWSKLYGPMSPMQRVSDGFFREPRRTTRCKHSFQPPLDLGPIQLDLDGVKNAAEIPHRDVLLESNAHPTLAALGPCGKSLHPDAHWTLIARVLTLTTRVLDLKHVAV